MQDRSSKDGMSSCRIGPVRWDDIMQDRSSKDGMSSWNVIMQDRSSKDGMTLCWTDPVNMRWKISEILHRT